MPLNFEQEIMTLRAQLVRMAELTNRSVDLSMQSLLNRNDHLARQVEKEDSVLDQMEMTIDDKALRLLANAPLALDVRFITVAMKISHDLERVGDEATTISRRALELNQEPQLKEYIDIPQMARQGMDMLRDGLDAFLNRDSQKARNVIPMDKLVDTLNRQLHSELAGFMIEKPVQITRCLNLMVISKSLERIADHATNIAEEVVYYLEGRDIRHQKEMKMPY